MPAINKLVDAIHSGLANAWLFAFKAADTPSAPPKPEYVGTVTVAQQILSTFDANNGAILRLEQNVQKLAAECLSLPLFSRLRPLPSIPSRKIGSKGERERVDISIHDTKASILPVVRALVELKISDNATGLRADLTRNQQFMQLARLGRQNQLDASLLGFVVVDKKSRGATDGGKVLARLSNRYEQMAKHFLSPDYVTEVSLRHVSLPPDEEDEEFIHIVSVVVSFARPSTTALPTTSQQPRYWSESSMHDSVVLEVPPL